MPFVPDFLPNLDEIRAIPGAVLGLRPYRVFLVRRANVHASFVGERYETETEITVGSGQPPKVRQLSAEDMALGGYAASAFRVGPFTPTFTGGGVDLSALLSDYQDNDRGKVKLTGGEFGDDGALFAIKRREQDRSMSHFLTVERAP